MNEVSDLTSELIKLLTKRDNVLYPSLDNSGNAYVSVYAKLAVYIDYELTKDKIIKELSDEIARVKNEMVML